MNRSLSPEFSPLYSLLVAHKIQRYSDSSPFVHDAVGHHLELSFIVYILESNSLLTRCTPDSHELVGAKYRLKDDVFDVP